MTYHPIAIAATAALGALTTGLLAVLLLADREALWDRLFEAFIGTPER